MHAHARASYLIRPIKRFRLNVSVAFQLIVGFNKRPPYAQAETAKEKPLTT